MSDKVEKLLARLSNIWPKRIDEDTLPEWLADWEGVMKPFEPWVIEAAATRMVHSRTKPGFPFPAEVAAVCREVLADDRRGKPELSKPEPKANPYKLADDLIRGELGKRAAREGWALTLHDFIRENTRMPNEQECRRLIAIRDKFVVNLVDCQEGRGGEFGGPLVKLGLSMAAREHKIAKRVLGEGARDWFEGKFNGGETK